MLTCTLAPSFNNVSIIVLFCRSLPGCNWSTMLSLSGSLGGCLLIYVIAGHQSKSGAKVLLFWTICNKTKSHLFPGKNWDRMGLKFIANRSYLLLKREFYLIGCIGSIVWIEIFSDALKFSIIKFKFRTNSLFGRALG